LDRIPVAGPWITEKEVAYVTDAVRNAWYGNANVYHERFEKAFSEHLGVRYTLALPSCTSAIHLALLALGVGPADEVIVPETTWIATSAPISYVGATPVFADIDPRTWCLSADSFERRITPRTKAVIPVDLYGGIGDLDAIRAVAGRHGIVVIEDAAQAIGAQYHGRPAGSLGDVGVFSFHGSKTLTTGEGGLLATNREDLYRRALVLRDHGRKPGDTMFCNAEVAHKYKMSAMQAALGLAQLERLESLIARKREIFAWYVKHLAGLAGRNTECLLDGHGSLGRRTAHGAPCSDGATGGQGHRYAPILPPTQFPARLCLPGSNRSVSPKQRRQLFPEPPCHQPSFGPEPDGDTGTSRVGSIRGLPGPRELRPWRNH